jgi:hypothetical protein
MIVGGMQGDAVAENAPTRVEVVNGELGSRPKLAAVRGEPPREGAGHPDGDALFCRGAIPG